MTTDSEQDYEVCPKCGKPVKNKSRVDARDDGGKLFDMLVHEYHTSAEVMVADACTHVLSGD